VIRPGDAGYDEARAVWNGAIDRHPALIVRCAGVADVMRAVEFARSEQLVVAVRGGKHSIPGFSTVDGGIVIDLSPMQGIQLDPDARTVRAQGGVTWSALDHETQAFGLAVTGGLVSSTGIAGFTLGGGIGWLMRKHGLTADNLIGADLVTADGRLVHASADENPGLFWGLRGGGGNFGIAASLEFETHPVDTILGGIVAYPLSEALPVFGAYQEVTAEPPDELEAFFALVHAPDGSGNKIVAVPLCHSGDIATGEALVAPLRTVGRPAVDLIGPMPYPVINTILDDGFPKGARNYWRSAFFKELSEDVVGVLVDAFERVPSPMSGMVIEHFHGAVTRIDPTATAYPHREPGYNLVLTGEWLDPTEDDANIAWVRQTFEALTPFVADAVYVNYLSADEPERVRAAYGPNWERLVALKRTWDPDNVLHLNQNIDPTA
jgi:FAD/FMN-containing dehydrogenase